MTPAPDRSLDPQLLQAQRMEVIGQLTAGIAHDFANLLTAMTGYLDLAMSDPGCSGRMRDDLVNAMRCADRAVAVSRRILSFSRTAGPERKTVDVGQLLLETVDLVRHLLRDNIHVEVRVDPGLHPVLADPNQLELALMNLAVNAQDAMPAGGDLVFHARNVILDEEFVGLHPWAREGKFVCLEVRDTGFGIPPSLRKRIFRPFVTTKPAGEGTGLGLSIVYSIAKEHRGYVHFESWRQTGTVFWMHLPACRDLTESATVMGARYSNDRDDGGIRVLLVEDESVVRDLAASALESIGCRILAAATAEEALRIFEQERGKVDLLFTDLVLPGANGRILAENLKAENPELQVLFTTGYSSDGLPDGIAPGEGSEVIQKPYSLADLTATVKRLVD